MCNWNRLVPENKFTNFPLKVKNFAQLFTPFCIKKTLEKKLNFLYFFFPFLFSFHYFIIFALTPRPPSRNLEKNLQNLSVARLGPRGASQILWVSKTRTSIAHANVSGLEFADERNEGQEAEAKARAKRRRYKTHITIHFFNFSFLGSWCEI